MINKMWDILDKFWFTQGHTWQEIEFKPVTFKRCLISAKGTKTNLSEGLVEGMAIIPLGEYENLLEGCLKNARNLSLSDKKKAKYKANLKSVRELKRTK